MLAALRRPLALSLGAALLVAGACSDSTGPNGSLTPEEIDELALQMGMALSGTGASASAAPASAGAASSSAVPAPFKFSIDLDVACPLGGSTRLTAKIEGTIDEDTESLTADLSGRHRPDDCAFDVHGKRISTTGSLSATAHVELENGEPVGTQRATLVGWFSWRSSDGRRGTCTVDYAASADYADNLAVVNGSFCGSTVQFSGPLTS